MTEQEPKIKAALEWDADNWITLGPGTSRVWFKDDIYRVMSAGPTHHIIEAYNGKKYYSDGQKVYRLNVLEHEDVRYDTNVIFRFLTYT